ncbi:cytochrome P450 [Russula earlei]|uniref:Cytochrome P450 n=1 Tax=Russula earlei TaxID=71964 RepID=A0ACC0TV77_9AGAM|nr:cytochrome P450 [Russula earlei]
MGYLTILAALGEADNPDEVDHYTLNKEQPLHLDVDADPDQIELDSEEFQDEVEDDEDNITLEEEEKVKATKSPLSKLRYITNKIVSSPQRWKKFRQCTGSVYHKRNKENKDRREALAVIRDAINDWVFKTPGLRTLLLDDNEWKTLGEMADILELFTEVTLQMSHSQVPTIPFVLPLYQKMEKHLEAILISWKHSFKIQQAAEQGLAKLRKYSIPAKLHHSYILGTVLHPCLRSHWFAATTDLDDVTAQEEAVRTTKDVFKYIAETYLETPTSIALPVVPRPVVKPVVKMPSFLATTTIPILKRTPHEELADELTRYFNFEAAPIDREEGEGDEPFGSRGFVESTPVVEGDSIDGSPCSFSLKAIQGYSSVFDYEAHMLLQSMYQQTKKGVLPINPANFVGWFVLNNMLTISFTTQTSSTLTEHVLAIATEFMNLTGPLSNIVDFINLLQWIPSPKQSHTRRLHDEIMNVYGTMIMQVKAQMDTGEDIPDCLVKTLILTHEEEKLDCEDMCMLAAVFTLGGIQSVSGLNKSMLKSLMGLAPQFYTKGMILWFLALISSNPEIQAQAHAELDKVIGRDYWLSVEDEQHLPYIHAVINEPVRIHSPFWMVTPHFSTEQFVYNGMYIPKDTALILNRYDIHHNKERFLFNPDRYLGDTLTCAESSKVPNTMDWDHWAFGAGERVA